MKRLIGTYQGSEKGTLMIVFGAMHGNEPAGVEALHLLFKMLEVEPITNPNFVFKGKLIGLRGHTRAMAQGKRFIHHDLNRLWTTENVTYSMSYNPEDLDEDFLEIKEINTFIISEIAQYQPEKIVILDLHTTSAHGGIFSIAAENPESLRIAKALHAPVIQGLLQGLKGTSLHYFSTENLTIPTAAVCFEAGQHQDPLSINRAIAAIIFALQASHCVNEKDINPQHTKILTDYAQSLPVLTHFLYRHAIASDDNFEMMGSFLNFQKISKGTLLAKDKNGDILAPIDCRILMPLYQKQGEDGFFLVTDEKA
jgi:succinylglutamate desuccinylase